MENFAVTSGDKTLLHAFIEKLEESGCIKYNIQHAFDLEDFERPCIVVYSDKIYDILNHSGGYILYNLPHQWLSAVSHLDSFQTKYEVNSFVKMRGLNGVWKLLKYSDDDLVEIIRYYNDGLDITKTQHFNNIERYATEDEIYDELIQFTDIEVGDEVIYVNDAFESPGIVKEIDLYSRLRKKNELSKAVLDYYKENKCDFLVATWDLRLNSAPVNMLIKLSPSLEVKTNRTNYKPELKRSLNNYTIGCIDDIDDEILYAAKYLMEFCEEKGMELSIDKYGDISRISVGNEITYSKITLDDVEQLINKLK